MSSDKSMSLKTRIVLFFLLVVLPIVFTSLFLTEYGRRLLENSATMFDTTVDLGHIEERLNLIHESLDIYLQTNQSAALEDYYTYAGQIEEVIQGFNKLPKQSQLLLAEKNLCNLWLKYQEASTKAIQAQRGRFYKDMQSNFFTCIEVKGAMEGIIHRTAQGEVEGNVARYLRFLNWYGRFQTIAFLLTLDVIIICIILIAFFSGYLSDPIIALADASKELARGNFLIPDFHTKGSAEVEILTKAYNAMKSSIGLHISELKEKAKIEKELMEKNIQNLRMGNLLKVAELMALQAQINPHFMFNTLNTGVQLAVVEGADKTADYLDHLASVYRYSLKKIEEDTTLGEEIETLQNFIYIMKIRFGGRIAYSLHIDEECHHLTIPSMILQPLVENSISHGLSAKETDGLVGIHSRQDKGYHIISVQDNGIGIPKEKIEEILSYSYFDEVEQQLDHNHGIGLTNVVQRFRIYYGRTDLVSIKSRLGEGTEILLRIPLTKGKRKNE